MKMEMKRFDDLDKLFEKGPLVPTVVQETGTGMVLMLAYMNRESLQKTLETGYTWFYSRSRCRLWHKGETSGHVQKVVSLTADCDCDTLLAEVVQTGPACHTGNKSCFFNRIPLPESKKAGSPQTDGRFQTRKGPVRRDSDDFSI